MLSATDIAAALQEQLPAERHGAIPALVQLVVDASTGAISEAQADTPGLVDALRALAGRTVRADSSVITFGSGSQMGDITIRDVAARDVINLHINISSKRRALPERTEMDFRDAMQIASSFADLLSYFLVARLFDLLGRNERRMQRGESKVSYYALLSVDRKSIRSYIYEVLGRIHGDAYIARTPFQLVDVLAAGTESDAAYEEIAKDGDYAYDCYINVSTGDIDVRLAQEQLKNTMLRLFERALRNPKKAISESHDYHLYKDKYRL